MLSCRPRTRGEHGENSSIDIAQVRFRLACWLSEHVQVLSAVNTPVPTGYRCTDRLAFWVMDGVLTKVGCCRTCSFSRKFAHETIGRGKSRLVLRHHNSELFLFRHVHAAETTFRHKSKLSVIRHNVIRYPSQVTGHKLTDTRPVSCYCMVLLHGLLAVLNVSNVSRSPGWVAMAQRQKGVHIMRSPEISRVWQNCEQRQQRPERSFDHTSCQETQQPVLLWQWTGVLAMNWCA